MKLIKWMTVTALATATVFGSFVESASAFFWPVVGSDYSKFTNELDFDFNLLTVDSNEKPIFDQESDLENIGFFPEAVTFIKTQCNGCKIQSITEEHVSDDINLDDSFKRSGELTMPVDLMTEKLSEDETTLLVRYTFKESRLDQLIATLDLSLPKELKNNTGELIDPINFLPDIIRTALPAGLPINRAVAPYQIFSKDNLFFSEGTFFTESITIVRDELRQIPEPNTTISIIVLGSLGLGFLQKRRLK